MAKTISLSGRIEKIRDCVVPLEKQLPGELRSDIIYDYSPYDELQELIEEAAIQADTARIRDALLDLKSSARAVRNQLRTWNAGMLDRQVRGRHSKADRDWPEICEQYRISVKRFLALRVRRQKEETAERISKAVAAYLLSRGTKSVTQIAAEVGLDRSTLYRSEDFKAAQRALRDRRPPAGFVRDDGSIEAISEDDV